MPGAIPGGRVLQGRGGLQAGKTYCICSKESCIHVGGEINLEKQTEVVQASTLPLPAKLRNDHGVRYEVSVCPVCTHGKKRQPADLECETKSCVASACCAESRDAAARSWHLAASEDLC